MPEQAVLQHSDLLRGALLQRKAAGVRVVDASIRSLLDDLIDTLHAQRDPEGVGLAAPQIGRSLRVIVAEPVPGGKLYQLVNPEIVEQRSRGVAVEAEMCLSLPGIVGAVPSALHIVVHGLDRQGRRVRLRADGLLARILRHEVDHCNGILFTQRANPETIMTTDELEAKLTAARG